MSTQILITSIFVSAIIASTAHAAPQNGEGHTGKQGHRGPISIEEVAQRSAARMQEMDTNGDDAVDLAEFEAAKAPERQGRRARHDGERKGHHRTKRHTRSRREEKNALRPAVQAELFAILDSNGDGSLSTQEFQAPDQREAHALARKRAMFKHLDKDGNGVLSTQEMPDPSKRLTELDANGDGEVSRKELRAHRRTTSEKDA